jgi:hypothetical protein
VKDAVQNRYTGSDIDRSGAKREGRPKGRPSLFAPRPAVKTCFQHVLFHNIRNNKRANDYHFLLYSFEFSTIFCEKHVAFCEKQAQLFSSENNIMVRVILQIH